MTAKKLDAIFSLANKLEESAKLFEYLNMDDMFVALARLAITDLQILCNQNGCQLYQENGRWEVK